MTKTIHGSSKIKGFIKSQVHRNVTSPSPLIMSDLYFLMWSAKKDGSPERHKSCFCRENFVLCYLSRQAKGCRQSLSQPGVEGGGGTMAFGLASRWSFPSPHSIYLCQSCPKANQNQWSIKSKFVIKPQMKSLKTASELLIICSPSTCCRSRKCFLTIPMNLFYYLQVGSAR